MATGNRAAAWLGLPQFSQNRQAVPMLSATADAVWRICPSRCGQRPAQSDCIAKEFAMQRQPQQPIKNDEPDGTHGDPPVDRPDTEAEKTLRHAPQQHLERPSAEKDGDH